MCVYCIYIYMCIAYIYIDLYLRKSFFSRLFCLFIILSSSSSTSKPIFLMALYQPTTKLHCDYLVYFVALWTFAVLEDHPHNILPKFYYRSTYSLSPRVHSFPLSSRTLITYIIHSHIISQTMRHSSNVFI